MTSRKRKTSVGIIQLPYDGGKRSVGIGRGAEYLIEKGLVDFLEQNGFQVSTEVLELKDTFQSDVRAQFELSRQLNGSVERAKLKNRFPLVLAGNCSASLGFLGSARQNSQGVVWLDAHGDFNTPETTISGSLDGMALATVAGLCWTNMASSIGNFEPVDGNKVLLIGPREFDAKEKDLIENSAVNLVSYSLIRELGVNAALSKKFPNLFRRAKNAHLHIDLDVFESSEITSKHQAPMGGLNFTEVSEVFEILKRKIQINSLLIAGYDPGADLLGKTVKAVFELILKVLK